MTHTPGPWKAITKGADARVKCPDGRSFLIGDLIYHDENKDNAHLIAAAPDMLEVLEYDVIQLANLASMCDEKQTKEYMTSVYAAIAQAKGEEKEGLP